jgi:hypothetical protein
MKNIFLPFHSPFDLPIPSGDRPKISVGTPSIGPFSASSSTSSSSTNEASHPLPLSRDSSVLEQDQAIPLRQGSVAIIKESRFASEDNIAIIEEDQTIFLSQDFPPIIKEDQAVPKTWKYKSNSCSNSVNPFDLPLPSSQRPKISVSTPSIIPFSSSDEASNLLSRSLDSCSLIVKQDQAVPLHHQGSLELMEEDQVPLLQDANVIEEDQGSISLKMSWAPEVFLVIGVLASCTAIAFFARTRMR